MSDTVMAFGFVVWRDNKQIFVACTVNQRNHQQIEMQKKQIYNNEFLL